MTETLLEPLLMGDTPIQDVVVVRVHCTGRAKRRPVRAEVDALVHHDPKTGLTAMQRCTGFDAAIVAAMMASGRTAARSAAPADRMARVSVGGRSYLSRSLSLPTVGTTITGFVPTTDSDRTIAAGLVPALNMDTGAFVYTLPASVTQTVTETFGYTITDNEGDTASSTLNFTVQNVDQPPAVNTDTVITSINGSGAAIPAGVFTDNAFGSTLSPNDFDHALKMVELASLGDTLSGALFQIHFQSCDGASAITAGEFTCTVLDAANSLGDPIKSGVTCGVTVP
jgi:hypothetical protein